MNFLFDFGRIEFNIGYPAIVLKQLDVAWIQLHHKVEQESFLTLARRSDPVLSSRWIQNSNDGFTGKTRNKGIKGEDGSSQAQTPGMS